MWRLLKLVFGMSGSHAMISCRAGLLAFRNARFAEAVARYTIAPLRAIFSMTRSAGPAATANAARAAATGTADAATVKAAETLALGRLVTNAAMIGGIGVSVGIYAVKELLNWAVGKTTNAENIATILRVLAKGASAEKGEEIRELLKKIKDPATRKELLERFPELQKFQDYLEAERTALLASHEVIDARVKEMCSDPDIVRALNEVTQNNGMRYLRILEKHDPDFVKELGIYTSTMAVFHYPHTDDAGRNAYAQEYARMMAVVYVELFSRIDYLTLCHDAEALKWAIAHPEERVKEGGNYLRDEGVDNSNVRVQDLLSPKDIGEWTGADARVQYLTLRRLAKVGEIRQLIKQLEATQDAKFSTKVEELRRRLGIKSD